MEGAKAKNLKAPLLSTLRRAFVSIHRGIMLKIQTILTCVPYMVKSMCAKFQGAIHGELPKGPS